MALMQGWLLVAAGGALGSVARYGFTAMASRLFGTAFPWGTLGVNVLGSFVMGVVAGALVSRMPEANNFRLFALTGVLGGFTTFSAFSLDVAGLFERGHLPAALTYVVVSVVASLAAVFAGLYVVRILAA